MTDFISLDLVVASPPVDEPIGFVKAASLTKDQGQSTAVTKSEEDKLVALKKRRAFDMGIAPGKQMFMTMFMLWMSGAGVHIFSIMIVGMAVWTPIKAITTLKAYFQPVEADGVDLLQPKLMYVALNFLALGVALYKCLTMGLLPLSSADWVNLVESKRVSEMSGGGIALPSL